MTKKDISELTPEEINYSVVERMHSMSAEERADLLAKMSDAQLAKIMELTSPEARRKRMASGLAAKLQTTEPAERPAVKRQASARGIDSQTLKAAERRVISTRRG